MLSRDNGFARDESVNRGHRDREAVRAIKRLVRRAQREGFEAALALGLELQASLLKRPEFSSYVESC